MSNMEVLSPSVAANIAKRVYDPLSASDKQAADKFHSVEGNEFELQDMMDGVSGSMLLNKTTKFGYIARHKNRPNEALVATRGTASGFDAWTDLVGAFDIGPSGLPIHSGFNSCYRSFREPLLAWFQKNPEVNTVHCVGHSLGGALATIVADQLTGLGKTVALYTFGSPRVGTAAYSYHMAKQLGARHFRVHNQSDPVTMVGPWVYTHLLGTDYALPWDGWSIAPSAHKVDNYIAGVKGAHWGNLGERTKALANIEANVRAIMESGSGGNDITMLSTRGLATISKCLGWILSKASSVVSAAALGLVTVLDQLAYLVNTAYNLPELSNATQTVLGWILKFLGRTAEAAINVTAAFLRWCLGMFLRVIGGMAQRAMYQAYYFPHL